MKYLPRLRVLALMAVAAGVTTLASGACNSGDAAQATPTTLRLGYFPNLTHATAIAGVERHIFSRHLSPDRLKLQTFSDGTTAVEALFSGALDAAYLGPNPAINAFAKSHGEAIRIVSGATSGGAALVVRPSITSVHDLEGTTLATPKLGNTQDVALRAWLRTHHLRSDVDGGGDVRIVPQENSQTLDTFKAGHIDGAWVPEPWASRLVVEGGGRVLQDEAGLWPGGRFVTTHLVVRTAFLREHPDTVRRLVGGQLEANRFVNAAPEEAKSVTNAGIRRLTGKALPAAVMDRAWKRLTFTNDPIAASLDASARHAEDVGLLEPVDLHGIYDLRILNGALRRSGQQEIATP